MILNAWTVLLSALQFCLFDTPGQAVNWQSKVNMLAVMWSKENRKLANHISLKQCSALQFPKEKNTIHSPQDKHTVTVTWSWHKILDPDSLLFISLIIASSASIHCPLSLDSAKLLAISQALLFSRNWECRSAQLYFTNTKFGSLWTYYTSVVTPLSFQRSLYWRKFIYD